MNFSDIHMWGLEYYLEGNERFVEKLDRFDPKYFANLGGRREAVNSIFPNPVQGSCRSRTESEQPKPSVEDIHYEDSSSRNVTDQCAPSPPPGLGADNNRIAIHDNYTVDTPNGERKHRKTNFATNTARRLNRKFDVKMSQTDLNAYRVSQPKGSKDRHSKVCTSKGPRDRRMRLSVETAIKLYNLQDRLGFDQPSKTVEWLLQKAKAAIRHLSQPSPISDSFLSADSNTGAASLSSLQSETLNSSHENSTIHNGSQLNFISAAQSFPASTTESNSNPDSCVAAAVTPKGGSRRFTNTGVVLSRRIREIANPTMLKENRAKARERARERTRQKRSTKQNRRFHTHALQSLAENPTPCLLGFEKNGFSSSMKFMSIFNEDASMLPQENSFLSATDIEIQNSSVHCPSSQVKDSSIQSILSQTLKQSPPKVTTHSLQNACSRYSLDECGLPSSMPCAYSAGFTMQNPVSLISGIEFFSECHSFHSMQDLQTGCGSPGEFVQPDYSDALGYTAVSSSPIPPYPTSDPLLDCSYYVTDFPLDI